MSVYKAEKAKYLDRAIKSVWDDQTLKPDEIILIKDGPLGGELNDIISSWKAKISDRLRIITNEKNLGLTKSLNKGIAIARGEYIARMDSDDISMPRRFERQAMFLDSHPDIAVIGGSLQEFDSENENLGVRQYPLDNDAVLKYIHKASPLAHPTVMIRREVFERGILYDERYKTSQDIALWFDILAAGHRIANLEEVTIKFRRDGDVYKRRSKEKAENEFKIYVNGIRRIYGLATWRYVYPLARYIFRMMPVKFVRAVYDSKLRTRLLQ